MSESQFQKLRSEVEQVISAQLWNESYGKVQAVTNSVMSILPASLATKPTAGETNVANALTIRIETTGVVRSGNSKAGNEYHMCRRAFAGYSLSAALRILRS
ncbi:hypothetical protein [Pseudomonas aeruginosa]|uniref:hypothetical protein n=1 Tax=Pseudomonas aeruginosa TaxID=287 RepID=UPI0021B25498|nr:hypothetical protein [Pseudomonas aeruginosa]MCT7417842.1 hypothetical protein [Pseudomonas aeruginosa]